MMLTKFQVIIFVLLLSIANNIYKLIAQELLPITSRLAFALDAWVALILLMELTIILLLAKKENAIEEISTHYFGFA
jgi:hypothetical protein